MFGLSMFVCGTLATQSTTVILNKYSLEEMLWSVEKHKATRLPVVPPMVVQLVRLQTGVKGYDLASVKEVMCSGAPLGRVHMDRFSKCYPQMRLSQVEDMGSSSSETLTKTSSDASDNEWEVAELVVSKASNDYSNKFYKRPYRSDSLTGKQYVINVLEGHEDRSLDMFRMKANVVYDLCGLLRDRKLLHDTRYVSVEEQICKSMGRLYRLPFQ